uniref:Hexosyltransferase n=1 Tax=Chrysotila carterae TaxID=13221 RepID=A0A7S4C6C5_CHRCT
MASPLMCSEDTAQMHPELVDWSPWLAVFGIFSHDGHANFRSAIRNTYLANAGSNTSISATFAMRGIGAAASTLEEARTHGDITFLPAHANLTRAVGPLVSLRLWFECALARWPAAELIGKADDDAWIHLEGVSAHLRGTLNALRHPPHSMYDKHNSSRPHIYWGFFQTFHWHLQKGSPIGFSHSFGRYTDCSAPLQDAPRSLWEGNSTEIQPSPSSSPHMQQHAKAVTHTGLIGPFSFARGALNFLSRPLVAELLSNTLVRAHWENTEKRNFIKGARLPWEDVYTGLGLSHAIAQRFGAEQHPIAFVDAGNRYVEGWSFTQSDSSIVYHMLTKNPTRFHLLQEWSESHHCHPLASEVKLRCSNPIYRSCIGAEWLRCRDASDNSKCPESFSRLTDLKKLLRSGQWRPRFLQKNSSS